MMGMSELIESYFKKTDESKVMIHEILELDQKG